MKVFVTGGNGFIGSAVVRILVEEGHDVRCLLRPTSDLRRIDGLRFERIPGDVRDAVSVQLGAEGCDGIIHLASLSNWADIRSPAMKEVVIDGSRNVLMAARAAGDIRTVFVSSSTAIGGTTEPEIQCEDSPCTLDLDRFVYVRAKRQVEEMCLDCVETGLPVVIVNPCEVYGPNDDTLVTAGNLIDFVRSNPVVVCTGGTSVVYVDDVAMGIVRALQKGRPGQRYILGGDNLTIHGLAELTLSIVGIKKRIVTVPNGLLRTVARVGGSLRIPLPFNPEVIPYATLFWYMCNSKAMEELGVSFRSARDTLEPTLAWLKESGRI